MRSEAGAGAKGKCHVSTVIFAEVTRESGCCRFLVCALSLKSQPAVLGAGGAQLGGTHQVSCPSCVLPSRQNENQVPIPEGLPESFGARGGGAVTAQCAWYGSLDEVPSFPSVSWAG